MAVMKVIPEFLNQMLTLLCLWKENSPPYSFKCIQGCRVNVDHGRVMLTKQSGRGNLVYQQNHDQGVIAFNHTRVANHFLEILHTFPGNPIVLMKISWKSQEILLFLKKSHASKGSEIPFYHTYADILLTTMGYCM